MTHKLINTVMITAFVCTSANAAEFELKNNTAKEISFAVIYDATVSDGPPFYDFSHVSRGVGFWTVPPYGKKKVRLTKGTVTELWLYMRGWNPDNRDSIVLRRAQYSARDKIVIAEIPRNHSLQTTTRGNFPSANSRYTGQLRVTPQHLGKNLTRGRGPYTFYKTKSKGSGTLRFIVDNYP